MLRTIILDDEELARKSLSRLVEKNPELELKEAFDTGSKALEYLKDNEVDLILLDVEMPEMTGFQFLEALPVIPTVIMTTTKENYAFDAYQYEVFDYLKKPVAIPKFNAAIDKLIQSLKSTSKTEENLDHIYLKVDNRLLRISFSDILYIENVGDYIKVVTGEDKLIVYATMKSLMERLLENKFMRVHRTYIVHLDKIRDIEQNSLVVADKVIPVSRSAKPELMERLNML